jgi:hypothetical protein
MSKTNQNYLVYRSGDGYGVRGVVDGEAVAETGRFSELMAEVALAHESSRP